MKYLNPQELRKKIHFNPHEGQMEILRNQKRFMVICAGRRFGKSLLVSYIAFKTALLSRKNIWIVAPTYELARKSFDYISEWISRYFEPRAFKISFSIPLSIEFPYGSKILFKSSENPTSLLGESLDLLILDEAARQSREIWESYLRPSLSDRRGRAFFVSTPHGKNYFFLLWQRGQDAQSKDWVSFRFPSSGNPHLSQEDLEEARNTLPRLVFQQEYEAIFQETASSYFRNVRGAISDELNWTGEPVIEGPKNGHLYVGGLDLGRRRDFTAFVIVDMVGNRLVAFDRFNLVDWDLQVKRIKTLAKKYGNPRIFVDVNNMGDVVIEQLRKEGLMVEPVVFTSQSKKELFEKLSLFIENKKITYPEIPVLISELESFGYEYTAQNRIKLGAPEGMHDDSCVALALGCWSLPEKPLRVSELIVEPIIFKIPRYGS